MKGAQEMEMDAIVRVVREKVLMVAWVTDDGLINWVPRPRTGEAALFAIKEADASFVAMPVPSSRRPGYEILPLPVLVIHGIKGLSATDDKWKGDDELAYIDCWKRALEPGPERNRDEVREQC